MKKKTYSIDEFREDEDERRKQLGFYKVINFFPTKLGVAVLTAGGIFALFFSVVLAGLAISLAAAGTCFGLAFWGTHQLALKTGRNIDEREYEDQRIEAIEGINCNIENLEKRLSDGLFPKDMRINLGKIRDTARRALEKFLEPPESDLIHVKRLAYWLEKLDKILDNYKELALDNFIIDDCFKTEKMKQIEDACLLVLDGLNVLVARMDDNKLFDATVLLRTLSASLRDHGAGQTELLPSEVKQSEKQA